MIKEDTCGVCVCVYVSSWGLAEGICTLESRSQMESLVSKRGTCSSLLEGCSTRWLVDLETKDGLLSFPHALEGRGKLPGIEKVRPL